MRVVRVNFNTEHKAMLGHCKMILESEVMPCFTAKSQSGIHYMLQNA